MHVKGCIMSRLYRVHMVHTNATMERLYLACILTAVVYIIQGIGTANSDHHAPGSRSAKGKMRERQRHLTVNST